MDDGVRGRIGPPVYAGFVTVLALVLLGPLDAPLHGQSLRGSQRSLDVQNRIARSHDFSYLVNGAQVRRFVSAGYLVPVRGNRDYRLDNEVSFPYARPEVRTFLERLGAQYRSACGEQLVVTSLTRPQTRQPRNASDRSVHPTGMAVDLRYSHSPACRRWLESVLLQLEERQVVEATRERFPPHYHVAVFPRPYARYVARIAGSDQPSATVEYQVKRGDSLWGIARSMDVSMAALRAANNLRNDRIYPGQLLRVPTGGGDAATMAALEYQVQRGDTLWKIARSHETSVDRIRTRNDLASDYIRPGQVLTVPVGQ